MEACNLINTWSLQAEKFHVDVLAEMFSWDQAVCTGGRHTILGNSQRGFGKKAHGELFSAP
jgi:hypothetical protein